VAINAPVRAATLTSFGESFAHLLGAQMTQIIIQSFDEAEEPYAGGAFEMRVGHWGSHNAKSAVFMAIPRGYVAGTVGSWDHATAETTQTLYSHVSTAGVVDLGDCTERFVWVVPVTPDAFNDHVFTLDDCRPHSLIGWESPVSLLTGTDYHVDRSVADAGRYITDDVAMPRGWSEMVILPKTARSECRRHLINFGWPYPAAGGGGITSGAGYMIGSAAADDGILIRPRDVMGAGVTDVPCKLWIYVSDVDASTFTVEVEGDGTGSPWSIVGIDSPDWWPAGGGLALNGNAGIDYIKLKVTRTAGAGLLTLNSVCMVEMIP
jgi:hypothetical protein